MPPVRYPVPSTEDDRAPPGRRGGQYADGVRERGGGDPDRLLRRCRDLVDPAGAVLVEVDPPGTPTWSGEVVLTDATGVSSPFRWAFVAADALWRLAGDAGLRVADSWTEADRWFANLARA